MAGDRGTHIGVACLSLIIPAIFLPCYLRILTIFILRKKYRLLECYKIMIQIGVAQCLMAPSWICFGIAHLLEKDYFSITAYAYVLATSVIRAEAVLSVLLALNRLSIICRIYPPKILFLILNALAWLVALLQTAVLLSPIAGFYINPDIFRPGYDDNKPLSSLVGQIGNYFLLVVFIANLLIYMILVCHLSYQKTEVHVTSKAKRERDILLYAAVRFAADFTCVLSYQFGVKFLPQSHWTDIVVYFSYSTNNLILPVVLYLVLHKSIRRDFFSCSSTLATWSTATIRTRQNSTAFMAKS
ncbi:hypothetical protein L596_026617 [Steinernema carpocapsae]|uniref:7TM GPCR serpentine receptor class x (Srx) domain-containing protein n=1 Tax=Steinernema carpocapsae TaxID=34508 RepID=A0A4U5M2V9_STECR|nr:hypothetical protein L596_026617 [Steinernema carpocapsae]